MAKLEHYMNALGVIGTIALFCSGFMYMFTDSAAFLFLAITSLVTMVLPLIKWYE